MELPSLLTVLGSPITNNIILFGGVWATIRTIKHTRTIAKQKETALLLFHARTDNGLRDGYRVIRELHCCSTDNIVSYATDPDKKGTDKADKIRYVLNHWERIAICVEHQIYCEKILKESNYTSVVNIFEQAEPFIRALRRDANTETIYQDLECMVKRWRSAPLTKRSL